MPGTPQTVAFAIRGPIARSDVPGLCEHVCALLETCPIQVVDCEVGGVVVDAVTVHALARIQLAARRRSRQMRLRNASRDLRELVTFMGLRDVLPGEPSRLEA